MTLFIFVLYLCCSMVFSFLFLLFLDQDPSISFPNPNSITFSTTHLIILCSPLNDDTFFLVADLTTYLFGLSNHFP